MPACAAALLALLATSAQAALSISATRVILAQDKRSAALIVRNPSREAYAAQVWVNTGADDTHTPVPLLPAPGLFRLEPGQEQMVTLNRLPHDLPTDRESVFWFNLQEIPQATAEPGNRLRLALRTRIKVFLRPTALRNQDPTEQLPQLRWRRVQEGGQAWLQVDNPTPFHYSFRLLKLSGPNGEYALTTAPMAEPFSQRRYPLPQNVGSPARLALSVINDYGGDTPAVTLPLPEGP